MLSNPIGNLLYSFVLYMLAMFIFLGISIGFHELGHVLFARLNHLEYRILYNKGNLTVSADWDRIRNKKVYGHMLGIIFGLPPIIAGGWLYSTPLLLLPYLLACYDDFGAVAREMLECRRIFGLV